VLAGEDGINEYVKTRRRNTEVQWLPLALDPVLNLQTGNDVGIALVRTFQTHIEITFTHDNVLLKTAECINPIIAKDLTVGAAVPSINGVPGANLAQSCGSAVAYMDGHYGHPALS